MIRVVTVTIRGYAPRAHPTADLGRGFCDTESDDRVDREEFRRYAGWHGPRLSVARGSSFL
jgi:hypothetical protein